MNNYRANILYIDKHEFNLHAFKALFRRKYNVFTTSSEVVALEFLKTKQINILLVGSIVNEKGGIEYLRDIKDIYPGPIRLLFAKYSEINLVIDAINSGIIYSYITRPWTDHQLTEAIEQALQAYDTNLQENFIAEQIKNAEDTPVDIALIDHHIHLKVIEQMQNACGDFMEAMGFKLKSLEEPVYGSFFQRIWYKLTSPKTIAQINDIMSQGKEALQANYQDKPSAEATAALASAAAQIIKALENVDDAATRLATLLIIKTTNNGKSKVVVETISPKLSRILNDNPSLLQNPHNLLDMINEANKPLLE